MRLREGRNWHEVLRTARDSQPEHGCAGDDCGDPAGCGRSSPCGTRTPASSYSAHSHVEAAAPRRSSGDVAIPAASGSCAANRGPQPEHTTATAHSFPAVCRPRGTSIRTRHATHTHDRRILFRWPPGRSSAYRTAGDGTRPCVPLRRGSLATCAPTRADTARNPTSGTAGWTRRPPSSWRRRRPARRFGNEAGGAAALSSRLPLAANARARRGSFPSVRPFT